MRVPLGVAFLVVTSVAAFTYRDVIVGRTRSVQRPVPRPPLARVASAPIAVAPRITAVAGLSVDSLNVVDSLANGYIAAIQETGTDVRAMADLAFLYMKHGWFDRAVGPLARAREVDPSSEHLRRYLELALARGGSVDLDQAAREFEEMVAMWGHGC